VARRQTSFEANASTTLGSSFRGTAPILFWFERIVGAMVGSFDEVPAEIKQTWALPCWNYDRGGETATLRLPSAPRSSWVAAPTRSSSSRDDNIKRDGALNAFVTIAKDALDEADFALERREGETTGFGGPVTGWHHFDEIAATPGELEKTPHNGVHGGVGARRISGRPQGLMSGFATAPLDPIFWLHHANIDRLWVD
jgi:tyrosinase